MTIRAPSRHAPAALSPAAAISLARDLVVARGFAEAARSSRGDSVYLRDSTGTCEIRVSTHPRTAKRRRQYPGVATSIVIARPTSEAKLRLRVDAALRDARARTAGHAA